MPVSSYRECAHCSREFHTYKSGRKFCSRDCAWKANRGRGLRLFWDRVDKSGGPDACWPWKLAIDKGSGYGRTFFEGTHVNAHRAAWQLIHGLINDPLVLVCHRCDNRKCCNPSHLFLGSTTDNIRDAAQKGRMPKSTRHWSSKHPEYRVRGEQHGQSKLKVDDVRWIKRLLLKGVLRKTIAEKFGVSQSAIFDIAHEKTWKHVSL